MTTFKTSIRIEDNTRFGAVVSGRDGDVMVSLDGTFLEGTICLKLSQRSWLALRDTINSAIIKDVAAKLAGETNG